VEGAAVLEELLAMVAGEDEEGLPVEAQGPQSLDEPADLGVHGADRSVVPVAVVAHVGVGVEARLDPLGAGGHAECLEQRRGDELPDLLVLPLVFLSPGGISPLGVVGGLRPVGVVGIGDVEEDEEGHVAVRLQPGEQAVDVDARGLARFLVGSDVSSCTSSNPLCRFVNLPVNRIDDIDTVA
jgi:hypothetical protein